MPVQQTYYQVLKEVSPGIVEMVAEFSSGELMKAREKAIEVGGRVQYVKR